jgi:signal transduction histidine kinase
MVVGRAINEVFPTVPNEASFSAQIPGEGQVRRISVRLGHRECLLTVTSSSFLLPEAGNARVALLVRDVSNEERIHQLLGDFLANITHEFRTPLSALAASVELLTDQLSPSGTAEVEELLASLQYGIVNLQALIDNLLEAASIEAGRFRVSPHPSMLNSMLAEAVAIVRPLIVRHELSIEYPQGETSGLVLADRRRTVQALVNLLSNAIKHSPQGGVIRLHDVSVGKHIMVEIVDQGAGIPAEIRQQIFTRFSSSPNLTGRRAGAGLGLSVVKAIVEAQHGEVGFDDQGAGGTKFWFTLPMADSGEGQR